MIVAKMIFLFPPLLLLANAQSGGRLGFFSRPDFRRPRPWERPTVAPVPDTPSPIEIVTAQVTDSPRARTELPTNTFVSPSTRAPISSAPRGSPRGRTWARPVFQGPRSIAISTPTAITKTESDTKANDYSPTGSIVSSTTKPQVYIVTPATTAKFVDNHALYKDLNNFNSRGRYSPKLTHNKDDLQSDSTKMTTELPLTTEKISETTTDQTTTPVKNSSPIVSSTSTTTESVKYTIAPTTAAPFINNDKSLNNHLDIGSPTQAPLYLNERTTELKTTPEPSTAPRDTFTPTREADFYSKSSYPPYMSHNLNEPTFAITTIQAPKESPSSTTESSGYTAASSTNVPFVDEHKRYEDINLTAKTPIPFKIISSTEAPSASTNQHNLIYQENHNDDDNIASNSEQHFSTKAVTLPTTEPQEYIITASSKAPFVDVHKEYNNSFSSQFSVEYTNGQKEASEITSNNDYYNDHIHPVYNHETEKVSHYEQYPSATAQPVRYTVGAETELPFIDLHKMHDAGFTSGPSVEYTNGYAKRPEIPSSDGTKELNHNIYRDNNHNGNDYEFSSPKLIDTTQSTIAYQYRYPKITTEQSVISQTTRHTNTYQYSDVPTKPTTTTARYTTTTARVARLNNVYDVDNFKCKGDAYYSISNQCDEFIECKSGHPIQNSCPDGLHFNPAAKYAEFPCAYPSEVKCESNSVIRQPEPTSDCPRRYGYFSMRNRCDNYIMCQEGLATVMSCPAGLAFSVATSSCDWPSNVPDCLPDAFKGFTCPEPELNEDGEPIRSIFKYRYDKSCKKYIACQKGHPRLLSCDSGLAFDENSESCIDESDVSDCT